MGILSWVGGNNRGEKGASQDVRPVLEQLEPRLLLNADLAGIEPILTPDTPVGEQAICIDLDQEQTDTLESLPVLTVDSDQSLVTDLAINSAQIEAEDWGEEESLSEEAQPAETTGPLDDVVETAETISSSSSGQVTCVTQAECYESDAGLEQETAGPNVGDQQEIISTSETPSIEIRGPPMEIVFVESSLYIELQFENADLLGIAVDVFDAESDCIDHVTDILSSYSDLSAVHIVSHGAPGRVFLGTSVLDMSALDIYQETVGQWGHSLSENGDIFLYGCSVGYGKLGAEFVDQFATITGADVAASINPTGNMELGGDWQLELQTGKIETDISFVRTHLRSIGQLLTTYIVNSVSDNTNYDGVLTLREAIEASNSNAYVGDAEAGSSQDVDIVHFHGSLAGSSIVLSGELILEDDIAVEWLETEPLTIDAGHNSRILTVSPEVDVTLTGLRLTGGDAPGSSGGGIHNNGTLTLTNTIVSDNSSAYNGGGIYSPSGSLTLTNTTVSGNSSGSDGGGVYCGGTSNLTGATVSDNSSGRYGGGILNMGTMTLANSTVSGNSAAYYAGGIYNGGTLTLMDTIVVKGDRAGEGTEGSDDQRVFAQGS